MIAISPERALLRRAPGRAQRLAQRVVQVSARSLAVGAWVILLGSVGWIGAEENDVFEGRVLDAVTGAGIAGARIEIRGTAVASTSDPAGWFVLPRRPRPEEVLIVRANGYENQVVADAADRLALEGPMEIRLRAAPAILRERVVVTATRTPTRLSEIAGSVTILDSHALSTTPTSNLVDALGATAGLHSFSPFGNPQEFGLDVRGFTGGGFTSYFVVLVDGVQVNDVDSGLVDWNLLPLDRRPPTREYPL